MGVGSPAMTDLLSTSIGLQAINASFHQSQASFRQLQTRPIQVALVFGRPQVPFVVTVRVHRFFIF